MPAYWVWSHNKGPVIQRDAENAASAAEYYAASYSAGTVFVVPVGAPERFVVSTTVKAAA